MSPAHRIFADPDFVLNFFIYRLNVVEEEYTLHSLCIKHKVKVVFVISLVVLFYYLAQQAFVDVMASQLRLSENLKSQSWI
jgi:hypothetical protein